MTERRSREKDQRVEVEQTGRRTPRHKKYQKPTREKPVDQKYKVSTDSQWCMRHGAKVLSGSLEPKQGKARVLAGSVEPYHSEARVLVDGPRLDQHRIVRLRIQGPETLQAQKLNMDKKV